MSMESVKAVERSQNVLCRKAQRNELARLKELWKVCFHDEDAAINHFFDRWSWEQCAHVVEAEGELVSMLMALPFTMTHADGTTADACYIYAFCTAPDQQSKGYGRRLLAWTQEQAKRAGYVATIMVPAEQSLFDFYQTVGYEPCITCVHRTMTQTAAGGVVPRRCSVAQYHAEREKWLSGLPHISYDAQTLTYQQSLCRASGADLYLVGDGIAAVEVYDNTLQVKELLTSDPQTAVSALLALLGAERAEVRFPALTSADATPFGVVHWLTPRAPWHAGWLAFAYD